MGIPVRATRLGDLDLDPLEVRLGQSLTHIQNLDTALVKIEDDARARFFRLNYRFCNRKPAVKPLPSWIQSHV